MPEEDNRIRLKYTVITYVPLFFMILVGVRQVYLKLSPRNDDDKYEAYATQILDVFSKSAQMDVKKVGKVLQQVPPADLRTLFIARGLLMDEIVLMPHHPVFLRRLSSNVDSCVQVEMAPKVGTVAV